MVSERLYETLRFKDVAVAGSLGKSTTGKRLADGNNRAALFFYISFPPLSFTRKSLIYKADVFLLAQVPPKVFKRRRAFALRSTLIAGALSNNPVHMSARTRRAFTSSAAFAKLPRLI